MSWLILAITLIPFAWSSSEGLKHNRSKRQVSGICQLPAQRGPCAGNFVRYYFNAATARCERFTFGGCQGNGNNFATEQSCVWACERHARPPAQNQRMAFVQGFCEQFCPEECACSGTTLTCAGPRRVVPGVTPACTKTFDMSKAGITVLHNDSFTRMSNLEILDLSENQLRHIPANAFRGLTSLRILDLSGNNLVKLPATVFHHLPALEEIRLSRNQLSYLACETIDNLPNLRLVNVSRNRLTRLIPHPGTPLDQMTLDLSNNQLKDLNVPTTGPDDVGPKIYLHNNPLRCDCHLKALVEFYSTRASRLMQSAQIRCTSPSDHQGRPLLTVDSARLTCDEPPTLLSGDICLHKIDAGPCRASVRRYYYNPVNRRCEAFTYGGCLYSANNFVTLAACRHRCEILAQRPAGEVRTLPPTTVPNCNTNEVYLNCGPACEGTCANPYPQCLELCKPGCFCRRGYTRRTNSRECVSLLDPSCRGDVPVRPATPVPTPPVAPTTPRVLDILAPEWPENPIREDRVNNRIIIELPFIDKAKPNEVIQIFTRLLRQQWGGWTLAVSVPTINEVPEVYVYNISSGTTYNFRARTQVPAGVSPFSLIQSFTTSRGITRGPPTSIPRTPPPGRLRPPTAPQWPFPPSRSVGPDYVDLNFPGAPGAPGDFTDLYELYVSQNGAGFRFSQRYPVTTNNTVRRFNARPNTKYQFVIRRVTNGSLSPISRPTTVDTLPALPAATNIPNIVTTPPPLTSVWPNPSFGSVTPSSVVLRLPGSSLSLLYDLYSERPGTGRYSYLASVPSQRSDFNYNVSTEPAGLYKFVFRTRQGGRTADRSEDRVVVTPGVWPSPCFGEVTGEFITLRLPGTSTPVAYDLYRSSSGGQPTLIATLQSQLSDFNYRSPASPGTNYSYFFVVKSNGLTSARSGTCNVTTPSPGPTSTPPSGGQTSYEVVWQASQTLWQFLRSVSVFYRRQLPNGQFGGWQLLESGLPASQGRYLFTVDRGGVYEVRVVANATDGTTFDLARSDRFVLAGPTGGQPATAARPIAAYFAIVQPQVARKRVGDQVVFRCNHSSPDPSPRYTWSRVDGQRLPIGTSEVIGRSGETLRIAAAEWEDSGLYRCTVSTRFGELSDEGILVVTSLPTVQPQTPAQTRPPPPSVPRLNGVLQLSWSSLSSDQQARFLSFLVEYRRQRPDGSFGAWQRADTSGLNSSSTSYNLALSQAGTYETRVRAALTDGQFVNVVGVREINVSEGALPQAQTIAMNFNTGGTSLSASIRPNPANQTVDVVVKTNNRDGWVGFGISPSGQMPNSDILTGFVDDNGKGQLQDRFADGRFLPVVDESSQLTNGRVRKINGDLEMSFTIPCRSTDPRDVPFEGNNYFLFATGALLRNAEISYHADTRWPSPQAMNLSCAQPAGTVQPTYFAFIQPQLAWKRVGDQVVFRCIHNSPDPSPRYTWSRVDGQRLAVGTSEVSGRSGENLLISAAELEDSGQYRCNVSTLFGELSDEATLNVTQPQFRFRLNLPPSDPRGQSTEWIIDYRQWQRNGTFAEWKGDRLVAIGTRYYELLLPAVFQYQVRLRAKDSNFVQVFNAGSGGQ